VNNYKTFEGDPSSGFNESKYKFKLPKGYEVFDPGKRKWVSSIKVTSSLTLKVREKATAKFDAKNEENNLKPGTFPASAEGQLKITWGKYTKKEAVGTKPAVIKQGVTKVEFVP